jgi:hypothetical protein
MTASPSRLRVGWLGCALALAISCSHEAAPVVEPDDHPPLPEATPIGYLIDDAGELHLRDDQLAKLRDIDGELAQHLDAIAAEQAGPVPVAKQSTGGGRRGGGGRHGGGGRRGGGGAGAGAGSGSQSSPAAIANAGPTTFPADGAGSAAGSAAPPSQPAQPPADRAGDIKAAVARAFEVLDPDQQPAARKVLADHGVTVDPPAAASGSGEP